jgi:hypothetical protein
MKRFTGKVVFPFIDFILLSKKLIVFTVATIALFNDKLGGREWTFIAGIYIFGLLFLNYYDHVKELKSNKFDNDNDDL